MVEAEALDANGCRQVTNNKELSHLVRLYHVAYSSVKHQDMNNMEHPGTIPEVCKPAEGRTGITGIHSRPVEHKEAVS